MTTIATFCFPPETFVLGAVFESHPEAIIELERVIPTGGAVTPYFWVTGVDDDAIQRLLDAEDGIDGVEVIDSFDSRSLLRCNCTTTHGKLFDAVTNFDVALLAGEGTAEGWRLTLRGNEKTALTGFDRACREMGLVPELRDLYESATLPEDLPPDVTEPQREALALAYERGYYDDPRQTTLADLSAELDISRQALSSRLQRGYRTLIRSYILPNGEYKSLT
jgi:predicted DNA binding protein